MNNTSKVFSTLTTHECLKHDIKESDKGTKTESELSRFEKVMNNNK